MTIVVTFFGQHYFHNVDLRFASVNIMKIMLTKKSDTIVHNVRKIIYSEDFKMKNYLVYAIFGRIFTSFEKSRRVPK